MNLLTIGDYYHNRYGRPASADHAGIVSRIWAGGCGRSRRWGWCSIRCRTARCPRMPGMMIGAASVLVYTLFGGMWSVAVTDFIQMIIVIGMLYIGYEVSGQAVA
jgi:Na+/proline symporter